MRKKFHLKLTEEDIDFLKKLINKRTGKAIRVQRAKYILESFNGESIYGIAKKYDTNRPKIQRTLHTLVRVTTGGILKNVTKITDRRQEYGYF